MKMQHALYTIAGYQVTFEGWGWRAVLLNEAGQVQDITDSNPKGYEAELSSYEDISGALWTLREYLTGCEPAYRRWPALSHGYSRNFRRSITTTFQKRSH